MASDLPTRDKLAQTAARLFRLKGYHATGLTEILDEAGVPKGSLYHHFPAGKADLARAATDLTSAEVMRIIADSFRAAPDWRAGVTTFCHKLAKLFDILENADACPISALMFDGPEDDASRAHAAAAFQRIIDAASAEARRLGQSPEAAGVAGETLILSVQGAWTLARSRRDSAVLRALPLRLALD